MPHGYCDRCHYATDIDNKLGISIINYICILCWQRLTETLLDLRNRLMMMETRLPVFTDKYIQWRTHTGGEGYYKIPSSSVFSQCTVEV